MCVCAFGEYGHSRYKMQPGEELYFVTLSLYIKIRAKVKNLTMKRSPPLQLMRTFSLEINFPALHIHTHTPTILLREFYNFAMTKRFSSPLISLSLCHFHSRVPNTHSSF